MGGMWGCEVGGEYGRGVRAGGRRKMPLET